MAQRAKCAAWRLGGGGSLGSISSTVSGSLARLQEVRASLARHDLRDSRPAFTNPLFSQDVLAGGGLSLIGAPAPPRVLVEICRVIWLIESEALPWLLTAPPGSHDPGPRSFLACVVAILFRHPRWRIRRVSLVQQVSPRPALSAVRPIIFLAPPRISGDAWSEVLMQSVGQFQSGARRQALKRATDPRSGILVPRRPGSSHPAASSRVIGWHAA